MAIKTFIFDFDGTILDTESQDFVVVEAMWQAHDVALELDEWRKGLGTIGGFDPYSALESRIGRAIDRAHWKALNHERFLEHCLAQPLRPGVVDLIAYANTHGVTLTVGSSAQRDWVLRWLHAHDLHRHFATIVTANDVSAVKPSPEIFLTVAANVGAAPASCLVFEDSAHGATAASRAGMRCVAVPIPALVDAWMPPVALRLRSLADLPPAALVAQVAAAPLPSGD
ncbi:MAG: hypothetical protein RLZZ297_1663 [Chloroflexota bacterium]